VHIPMFEVYWTALQHVRALGPHTLLAHLAGLGVLVATLGVAAVAYRRVEEPARRRLLALHRPGRHQLPHGFRVPPIAGPRRAPRHALVLAGHRPAGRAA
jgi:peptidoglycan/LPS O-acetylase OafA/YrhL